MKMKTGWGGRVTSQGVLGNTRAGRGKEGIFLRSFGEKMDPLPPYFRCVASRIMREYISVTVGHPVYGNLFWQP